MDKTDFDLVVGELERAKGMIQDAIDELKAEDNTTVTGGVLAENLRDLGEEVRHAVDDAAQYAEDNGNSDDEDEED